MLDNVCKIVLQCEKLNTFILDDFWNHFSNQFCHSPLNQDKQGTRFTRCKEVKGGNMEAAVRKDLAEAKRRARDDKKKASELISIYTYYFLHWLSM